MHDHKIQYQHVSQLMGYTRYTQTCACGARRKIDINGATKLVSHWISEEDMLLALARRVATQRRDTAKTIGEPLKAEFIAEAEAIERLIEIAKEIGTDARG